MQQVHPSITSILHLIFACFVCYFIGIGYSCGQEAMVSYDGYRVSLFDFEVLQIRGQTILLKCRVANTGRMDSGINKNVPQTVVELDTFNLPSLLWGHESSVSAAARNNIPRLKPGEVSSNLWLSIRVKEPALLFTETSVSCPDLVVDTVYVYHYTNEAITLRYELQNIGSAPVEVAEKTQPLSINAYFISGAKLTRGAIQAANTTLQPGRETLTGWLNPNQKVRGELLVPLKNRTKFAPNILIELAPPSSMKECDRTNNTKSIEVRY